MYSLHFILNSKAWRATFEVIFILFICAGAIADGKTIPDSLKIISMGTIVVAAALLFISGDFRRVKITAGFFGVYGLILLGIIVWSVFLWIMDLQPVNFISRGCIKFGYQFIVLLIMAAGAYMLGERAVNGVFYGLVAANAVIVAIAVMNAGVPAFISDFTTFVQSGGEQVGAMVEIEIHDITFAFGFFVIYFIFFAPKGAERWICTALAIVFFIIGWKRIAVAALAVVLVFGFIIGYVPSRNRIRAMYLICLGAVGLGFGYVVFTKYNVLEIISRNFNINLMGRDVIYDYISDYYQISVAFLGYGFEYTTVLLRDIVSKNPFIHIDVEMLHNNILTMYIELGFIGFWAWIIYTWFVQFRYILKRGGEKAAMLFMMCEIYIFMTYTTDNTLYYFWTSLALRLMPLAYTLHVPKPEDKVRWPWAKIDDNFREFYTPRPKRKGFMAGSREGKAANQLKSENEDTAVHEEENSRADGKRL